MSPLALAACAALFLFSACAAGGTLPEVAVEHNTAGAESLAAGELDDAEARFRLALEYHPGFAESRANLGLVAFQRGQLDDAEGHLRAAIRLDANFDEAWSNLGLVLAAKGQIRDAKRAFETALAIDPGLVAARRNLADLNMRESNYVEARAHLMRLVQIVEASTADGARASAMLAYSELRLGREEEALYRAQVVLNVRPDESLARLVRGIAHAASQDFEAAAEDYAIASFDTKLRRDVQIRQAALYLAWGRPEEAAPIITVLLNDGEEAAVCLLAAHLALAEDNPDAALEHAHAALQATPGLPAALEVASRARSELDR
ncbi:MAG: tetratricopeptide (TPR) repeat protein [Polyangiales bacterium]|jgi:tetratricopeptide (TPR) repeat protein